MQFEELDLNYDVLDALDDMNFTECTPIQEQAIPPLLEGRDLIGVAQTGTGKTAAYLLPVLSQLRDGGFPRDAINCIIMSPTRELAQQIDQAMQGFAYYLDDISSVSVYGGNDGIRYEQEKRALQLGADVVIATPGRLISHLSLGNVDLSRVSFFILDEADRMLDMGFSEDIMQIVSFLPKERQTIMFSATMPDKIVELAKTILTNPVEVKIALNKPAEGIRQSAYVCYEAQKLRIVEHLFHERKPERVIIFVGKKVHTKDVAIALKRKGYNAEAMHSDLLQEQRDDVMYRFKTGQIDILVATDIVARGKTTSTASGAPPVPAATVAPSPSSARRTSPSSPPSSASSRKKFPRKPFPKNSARHPPTPVEALHRAPAAKGVAAAEDGVVMAEGTDAAKEKNKVKDKDKAKITGKVMPRRLRTAATMPKPSPQAKARRRNTAAGAITARKLNKSERFTNEVCLHPANDVPHPERSCPG